MHRLPLVLTVIIAALLLCGGCKKDKNQQAMIDMLAPTLINQAEIMLNDPDFRAKLGTEGNQIADIAVPWLLARVQMEIGKMASGTPEEQLTYKRIQRLDPDVALMIYRVNDAYIPEGLWPELEGWLTAKGYITTALTFDILGRYDKLTPADREELVKLAGPAIERNYRAVAALKPTVEMTPGSE
jgi:hypothetical protein